MSFARNFLLLHTAAYRLQAIDMVQIDFRDVDHLADEALQSYHCGFEGKQIIHPLQIEPVQRSYSPTTAAIAHAQAVVQAHEQHQAQGRGAFVYDGQMIDMVRVHLIQSFD